MGLAEACDGLLWKHRPSSRMLARAMAELHNPYAPPRDPDIGDHGRIAEVPGESQPATLTARLLGAAVDLVFELVILWVAGDIKNKVLGSLLEHASRRAMGTYFLLRPLIEFGVLALALAPQAILIAKRGQSLGKKQFRTCILQKDGRRAGLWRGFVLRTLLPWMVVMLPFVVSLSTRTLDGWWGISMLILFVEPAFIFGPSRRCGHDFLAGTYVAKLAPSDDASINSISKDAQERPARRRPAKRTPVSTLPN